MRHVVNFSGGEGSLGAAWRVAEEHGTENLTLLFSDTLTEDSDLYRFLVEAAALVYRRSGQLDGLSQLAAATPPSWSDDTDARRAHLERVRQQATAIMPGLVWLMDGRDIWRVFRDHRFLGNTLVDPCSRVLKREAADRWLHDNRDPADTIVYVGIDADERHRYDRLAVRRGEEGWRYEAPLIERPMDVPGFLALHGIRRSRLYQLGLRHNNCGGGCVKAGIAQFAHVYHVLPEVFAKWEREEQRLRDFLGKDVAILRDRRGGATRRMTLRELRERIEGGEEFPATNARACNSCFLFSPEDAASDEELDGQLALLLA